MSVVSWIFLSVGIYCHALDGNQLVQLRGSKGLLCKLMCKHTLNTLIWIQVIWSTEPTWNMWIIRYFSSVINLNKQRSNETLVDAVFWTSDLGDSRWACYQLSHVASLKLLQTWSSLILTKHLPRVWNRCSKKLECRNSSLSTELDFGGWMSVRIDGSKNFV